MTEEYKPKQFKEGEWTCRAVMGIDECRILYETINQYLNNEMIAKTIPEDHKSYLNHVHKMLFGMITDYNFHKHDK